MRELLWLFVCLLSVAQAIRQSGDRLLVVLEDEAEKSLYSQFLGDLEGALGKLPYDYQRTDELQQREVIDWLSSRPRMINSLCFDLASDPTTTSF